MAATFDFRSSLDIIIFHKTNTCENSEGNVSSSFGEQVSVDKRSNIA